MLILLLTLTSISSFLFCLKKSPYKSIVYQLVSADRLFCHYMVKYTQINACTSEVLPKYSWSRVERSALDSLKGSAHSVTESVIGLPQRTLF